jgi:hypothetical protein
MNETDRDQILAAMTALTESNMELARRFDQVIDRIDIDKKFRRWTYGTFAVLLLAVAALAGRTAWDVSQQSHKSCLRGNEFRRDIYAGIDAVVETLSRDASDAVKARVDEAQQKMRDKVPLRRDC